MTVTLEPDVREDRPDGDRSDTERHEFDGTVAAEPGVAHRGGSWFYRHRSRIALGALLLATALLYLVDLGASGWANPYYSAAAQAGSQSWAAWFFGSFDASNFITVDKTPAALWLTGLSVRIFGLNSWAMLVPQALCGVAAVGLLYATVRRFAGPVAGLIAGLVLASTPVAALMFRFNNPDALLVLLLIAGAYGVTRALARGQTGWLLLAGSAVGFAFLTKMLQAFLVLPAFGLVYLLAAPVPLVKRLWQSAAALGAMIVSAGWWIAAVELWPAASRPYIGGTQGNSILELTLGYNGLGRLTGEEVGSVGGNGGWGETGWLRMFNSEFGGQASWLIPAALVLLAVGLWATRGRPRTDLVRAGFLLWGGWLLVTGLVFSHMQGIIHPYYAVALAPAIGALVGAGAVLLWRLRAQAWTSVVAAVTLALTGWWAYTLLGRSATFLPWLRWAVLIGALLVACGLLAARLLPGWAQRTVALLGLVVALAGPVSYALQTAATAHSGALPSAGPTVAGGMGGRGGAGGGAGMAGAAGGRGGFGGQQGTGQQPGGQAGTGQRPGGTGTQQQQPGGTGTQATNPGGNRGGMGGLLNASVPSAELVAALSANADSYDWVAATTGANNAAGYQLATGQPVMALGGFNGSDAAPSLAQFQEWVAQGRIHYYLGGSGGGLGGGGSTGGSTVASEIAGWVTKNFTPTTVGGVTLYDLSGGVS